VTNFAATMDGDTVASSTPFPPLGVNSLDHGTPWWYSSVPVAHVIIVIVVAHLQQRLINVPPTATRTKVLMDLLAYPAVWSLAARHHFKSIVHELSNGFISVADFKHHDAVVVMGSAKRHSLTGIEETGLSCRGRHGIGHETDFLDHALPSKQVDNYYCSNTGSDMLACMEFCSTCAEEEDDLTVASLAAAVSHSFAHVATQEFARSSARRSGGRLSTDRRQSLFGPFCTLNQPRFESYRRPEGPSLAPLVPLRVVDAAAVMVCLRAESLCLTLMEVSRVPCR
jgi:hypothetical protein